MKPQTILKVLTGFEKNSIPFKDVYATIWDENSKELKNFIVFGYRKDGRYMYVVNSSSVLSEKEIIHYTQVRKIYSVKDLIAQLME